MVKVYVPLHPAEVNRLVEIARAERRRPTDQAAYLLSKALGTTPTTTTGKDDRSGKEAHSQA